jgi:hypothetical protein
MLSLYLGRWVSMFLSVFLLVVIIIFTGFCFVKVFFSIDIVYAFDGLISLWWKVDILSIALLVIYFISLIHFSSFSDLDDPVYVLWDDIRLTLLLVNMLFIAAVLVYPTFVVLDSSLCALKDFCVHDQIVVTRIIFYHILLIGVYAWLFIHSIMSDVVYRLK